MKLFLLLLVAASSTLATPPLRFDGFQVHRVIPQTIKQLQALHQLEQIPNGLNFWTDVSAVGRPVDIMVPTRLKYDFKDLVQLQQLNTTVMIEDVQKLIDIESPPSAKQPRAFGWTDYHTLEEIYEWLNSLPTQYPEIVSTIVGGQTYEEREILGVKISFKSGNKGVFIEGGIHAREWIAPATVTYIVNQLLTSTDPAVRAVAESRDWYVFPVVNPDGYVYTQIDRIWRKTRQPYGDCFGADPNRNWGYHWQDGGASTSPCSDTFAGGSAFSEIESKSLSEYISSIAYNLDIYLGFHSYSQLLLIPFGHQGRELPYNNDELLSIAENATKALATRYGTQYQFGNIPETIYVASGGSPDWVLGTFRHIRLVYTFELRDTGANGFLLPPEQIIPTGEETLDAVVSIVQQAGAAQAHISSVFISIIIVYHSIQKLCV